jgi:hypothetical protein
MAKVTTTGFDAVAAETRVGTAPTLPGTVAARLSDGTTQPRKVAWDAVDVSRAGVVQVSGKVVGTTVRAQASVTVTGAALTVTAQSRCVGATAYVAVTAVNTGPAPVSVTLTTPYGAKTVADVAPGKSAYQSFNARAAQISAGTASAAAADGSVPAAYTAVACG